MVFLVLGFCRQIDLWRAVKTVAGCLAYRDFGEPALKVAATLAGPTLFVIGANQKFVHS